MQNTRWGHVWRGVVLSGGLLAGGVFADHGGRAATPSPQVQDFAGVWDLSIQGTNAKCRIALRAEQSSAERRPITIPLGCLKAFPDLASADAWALTGDGHIDLFDNEGQTVLDFASADATVFVASGPQGVLYKLTAMHGVPQRINRDVKQGRAAIASKQDVPVAVLTGASGRYAIMRDGRKDTGCMLTLDNQGKSLDGGKASLAPGCRDQGLLIFDPASWQVANGRLELTARKGHKTHLDAQLDGTWKKDPAEGKGLTLKKL